MLQVSNSSRVMETRDHSKNGASLKSHMSKRIFKRSIHYLLVISVLLFMQSCATMVLKGDYANLTNNSTYQGIEVQMTDFVDLTSKFQLDLHLGAGKLNILDSDFNSNSIDKDEFSKWNLSVGLGGTYYITKERFQPFIGVECHALPFSSDKNKKENDENSTYQFYGFVTPKVGLRFYLSNRIALQGSIGYHAGLLKIMEQKDNFSGFAPSIGICFILPK